MPPAPQVPETGKPHAPARDVMSAGARRYHRLMLLRDVPSVVLGDLRNVLDDLDAWEHDDAGWARVDAALRRVARALDAESAAELTAAVHQLELSGSPRIKDATGGTKGPQTARIREQATVIKDKLDPPQRKPDGGSGGR